MHVAQKSKQYKNVHTIQMLERVWRRGNPPTLLGM